MYTFSDCCTRQSSRVLAEAYYHQANQQILAVLFQRHRETVFRLCLSYLKVRIEAEDATMEIFEYLQGHLQKYRIRHFYPWLFRFTRNHCLRRLAAQKKRYHLPVNILLWEAPHPEIRSRQEHRIRRLHQAIDQLKSLQRECLLGFYFEEKSYKEIARCLGLSPTAVKSHIQNGKRNLRKMLAGQ